MSLLGNDRPDCPDCSMRMISFDGVKYDKKTFERLRCGHIEQPKIAGSRYHSRPRPNGG